MKRSLAVVTSVAAITVGVNATPAAAAPMTKNGLCGAKNMMNENARPHMMKAMEEHTAQQGDDGMFAAVRRTSCD